MFKTIVARLEEPSTHAGIAAIATALATIFPAYAPVLISVAVVFGGTAAAKADKPAS